MPFKSCVVLIFLGAQILAGQAQLLSAQQPESRVEIESSKDGDLNRKQSFQIGWRENSIEINGLDRWYRVFRPRSFQVGNPAVVLLHGGGQSMRKIFANDFNASKHWRTIAERDGLLLIVPNGTAKGGGTKGDRQNWNDLREKDIGEQGAEDVKFIESLVTSLREIYRFDPGRVYVTGASNGGMMTFRMLIEKPELFAAGVAFIASLPANYDRLTRPSNPKPLMMCNGTADALIKWQGGEIGRNRGKICPVEKAVAWWIESNRCEQSPKSIAKLADRDNADGCQIVHQIYAPKTGGSAFEFVKIEGGGHTLPSIKYSLPDKRFIQRLLGPMCHDIEGTELAWDFMKRQPPTTPLNKKN